MKRFIVIAIALMFVFAPLSVGAETYKEKFIESQDKVVKLYAEKEGLDAELERKGKAEKFLWFVIGSLVIFDHTH